MKRMLLAIGLVAVALPLTFAAPSGTVTTHKSVTHSTRHMAKSVAGKKHMQ